MVSVALIGFATHPRDDVHIRRFGAERADPALFLGPMGKGVELIVTHRIFMRNAIHVRIGHHA